MLTSLALILLGGLVAGALFTRLHLPSILGMILVGVLLGPGGANLLDATILTLSPEIRRLALVLLLIRVGFSLDIAELKRVGRPALLMCFVPASLEIAGTILIAPHLFGVSILDAALMGCVIGAVSPAVVVPRAVRLREESFGTKHGVPQVLLAGSSVDGVFGVIVFSALLAMTDEAHPAPSELLDVPIAIVLAVALGLGAGLVFAKLLAVLRTDQIVKVMAVVGIALLFLAFETRIAAWVPLSGYLAGLIFAGTIRHRQPAQGKQLARDFTRLWQVAEILLFVLVGAAIDVRHAFDNGGRILLLLGLVLLFRMVGVMLALLGTKFNFKERLFCVIAYVPKATVQAAIGGVPLAMGLGSGQLILAVAVLAILVTAPIGAIGMDLAGHRLLARDRPLAEPPTPEAADGAAVTPPERPDSGTKPQ